MIAREEPGSPHGGNDRGQSTTRGRFAQQEPPKSPHRSNLKREITIALAAKLVLLFALWLAFFNHPLDRSLNATSMDRVLLGSAATSPGADAQPAAGVIHKELRHDP